MDAWRSTPLGRGWDEFLGAFTYGGGSRMNGWGDWAVVDNRWDCEEVQASQEISAVSHSECLMRSYEYTYVHWHNASICRGWYESANCSSLYYTFSPWNAKTQWVGETFFVHLRLSAFVADWWYDTEPADPLFTKHSDNVITDVAITKLDELLNLKDSLPWSIVLSYHTPHADLAFAENGTGTAVVSQCERYFNHSSGYYHYDRGAMCQLMWNIDQQVGRVLEKLQKTGFWNDTLVILTSDNAGTSNFEPNNIISAQNPNYGINWPYRGGKYTFYEGALRNILGLSGGTLPVKQRGIVDIRLHSETDIAPTILGVAGFSEEESSLDSMDGFPLFSTAKARSSSHDYIYHAMPENRTSSINSSVLQVKEMKYIGTNRTTPWLGNWIRIPLETSVYTVWEECIGGCIWDLEKDPYEQDAFNGADIDLTPFQKLQDIAINSGDWTNHDNFTVSTQCTFIWSYGYRYYPPWKDNESRQDYN